MSRAVSSAPWGLARTWRLPQFHWGTQNTGSCTRKCSEHEIPRQPVTSGACLRSVCHEARCRSPPRHPCAPAPRSITPRGRLVRRVLLQAAPGTPGPARHKPNYCDPNLAHRRSVVEPDERCKRFWGQTDLTKHLRCHCEPRACALRSCEWRWACSKKQCRFYNHGEA